MAVLNGNEDLNRVVMKHGDAVFVVRQIADPRIVLAIAATIDDVCDMARACVGDSRRTVVVEHVETPCMPYVRIRVFPQLSAWATDRPRLLTQDVDNYGNRAVPLFCVTEERLGEMLSVVAGNGMGFVKQGAHHAEI